MKVKYPKNAMKTMYREFKNLHLGKKFERYLSLFASICWATVAVGFLYIGYGFLQMEGEIEGSIYETNKKAGTHYIGHVRTKKYAPAPPKERKTMVGIAVDYHILANNDRYLSNFLPKCKFLNSLYICLLYTSPSPRDRQKSRMPSSA